MAEPSPESDVLEKVKVDCSSLRIVLSTEEDQVTKIRLCNPTDHIIAFKIKSTRPNLVTGTRPMGFVRPMRAGKLLIRFKKVPPDSQEFVAERSSVTSDHLTIVIAVPPADVNLEDPVIVWKGPNGPPKFQKRFQIPVEYVPPDSPEAVVLQTAARAFDKKADGSNEPEEEEMQRGK
ncbi:Major sperm protein [Trichuris trichiura]|uniref:Major sperm protein n=1 Tax=Trichuris trichiura TaxID=36087 RepID=A0A077ZDP0_TRITR|nr:Major sperm protein [Trichuris trichiura]